jgi:hypothetical protein
MTQPATTSGSFFNCKTNPPWDLQEVLLALKQETRRRPLPNFTDVQHRIGRFRRYSGERNAPRGLRRFLTCYGVLVKDDATGKVYFDSNRGDILLDCCNKGKDAPLPTDPPEVRLERLKLEYLPNEAADPSPEETPPVDQAEYPPDDELDRLTAPATPPVKPVDPVEVPAPIDAPRRVMVPAPTPDPAPAPVPAQKPRRVVRPVPSVIRVMYLTPLESTVWRAVAEKAHDYSANSWRLGVPKDAQTMFSRWRPADLECDEEDLYAAFQRFVEHGVMKHLGQTQGNQRSYTLYLDPDWTEVRDIDARPEHVLGQERLDSIRTIQRQERSTSVGRKFAEELGIVGTDERTKRQWVCVRGFEKVVLVLPDPTPVALPPKPSPARPAPVPTPARLSSPALAVPPPALSTPTSADVVRELTRQRDELQGEIERHQAEIATLTVRRAKLDDELKRHQDAVRLEALKKRAALDAQRVELDAQRAALDRAIADLGMP